MRIYKFGGASVKDAAGVKNMAKVLKTTGYKDTLVIVSAMGKTTNALEEIVELYFNASPDFTAQLLALEQFHQEIISDLMGDQDAPLKDKLKALIGEMNLFIQYKISKL